MTIIKIIDNIWETNIEQQLDTNELPYGRHFVLSLQEDLKSMNRLLSREKTYKDKNNFVSGEDLFPITMVVWNWDDKLPCDKVKPKTSTEKQLRCYYYGISPELENFVTLVLWPEKSKHSREVLKNIWQAYETSKLSEPHKKLQLCIHLEGDYRIKFPNELHPFRYLNLKTYLNVRVFDWKYVPWLKETGDTIFSHMSPTNYRKVYLNKGGIEQAYINPRVGIGIIKNLLKSTNEIKLKLPYLNKGTKNKYLIAKMLLKDQLNDLKPGDIIYFVLLEVIHNKSSSIPERYIYYIEKADFIDILAHLNAFVLYNKYIEKYNFGLYVMSVPEFQKMYLNILRVALKYCKNCETMGFVNWDLLFNSYLKPFFRIIKQRIYYVPQCFTNNEYLEKKIGITYDLDSLVEMVDTLLLEIRGSRANLSFEKINFYKIMEELNINNVKELRSLLEITARVPFIKNLKRFTRGSTWRGKYE